MDAIVDVDPAPISRGADARAFIITGRLEHQQLLLVDARAFIVTGRLEHHRLLLVDARAFIITGRLEQVVLHFFLSRLRRQ